MITNHSLDFDIVAIGNAKIDAFLKIDNETDYLHLNNNKELCIKFGTKIPVESCEFLLGGSACNNIVGLSRLGLKTSLIAELGDDEFSQKIINCLSKENVNMDLVKKIKDSQTSFTIAINFQEERTLFNQNTKRDHNFNLNFEAKLVYLGGLGEEWKEAYKKVLEFVKNKKIQLAFSPGTPQRIEGYQSIKNVFEKANIIFLNKEDAERLVDEKLGISIKNESFGIRDLFLKLQCFSGQMIIITDGERGAYLMDEDGKIYSLEAFPAKVLEKTGAGDAFASGFLAAILKGIESKEAMKFGAVNASSVIQQVGAQPGLLSFEEIKKRLEEQPEFRAKEIDLMIDNRNWKQEFEAR